MRVRQMENFKSSTHGATPTITTSIRPRMTRTTGRVLDTGESESSYDDGRLSFSDHSPEKFLSEMLLSSRPK